MSIFNFWKKKEKAEETKDPFYDLEKTILEKKERLEPKEKEIVLGIKQKVLELTVELRKESAILEEVDLKDNRSDQRLKFIVLENLKNYISCIDILVETLDKLYSEKPDELIAQIKSAFIDFKNRSQKSREKSTYLIGKEIRDVKESIGKFFKELDEFIKDNASFFLEKNLIDETEELSKKIEVLNKSKMDFEEEKTGLENRIEEYGKKLEEIEKNLNEIKESEEYKEELEKKEKISSLKHEINKSLLDAKNFVDLKSLEKIYHHDEKKMNLIKSYEENFSKVLSNENPSLLDLLNEQKRKELGARVAEIKSNLEALKILVNIKNPLEKLEEEELEAKAIIQESKEELEKKEELLNKFSSEIEEIKEKIKAIFEKIDSTYNKQ